MIIEEEKYRAEVFKIVGIALLMPFGKVILNPITMFKEMGVISFTIYCVMSILSIIIGIIFVDKGRDILSHRFRRKE